MPDNQHITQKNKNIKYTHICVLWMHRRYTLRIARSSSASRVTFSSRANASRCRSA